MRFGVQAILPQHAGGNVRWYPTRWGSPVVAVVIHRMDGVLNGTDGWFRMAGSGVTSTHFGVGFMGSADRLAGRAQVRQWVDTAHVAYGWAARPTDVPTALARSVLGPHGLNNGSMDLNRLVIHVEVEGWSYQAWHPAVTKKVRELLAAIAKAHGPLRVLAHTDVSIKPCPGLATFHAALPGLHGARLTTIGGPAQAPAPAPAPTAGGLPLTAFMSPNPPQLLTLPAGIPVFAAPSFGAKSFRTTKTSGPYPLVGFTKGAAYKTGGKVVDRWAVYWIPSSGTADPYDGRFAYLPAVNATYKAA